MKSLSALLCLAALLCAAPTAAPALDDDARAIDWVSFDTLFFKDGHMFSISLWGETAIADPRSDWAVLFTGGAGYLCPDDGDIDEATSWRVGLGMKRYLSVLTAVSVLGTYESFDGQYDDPDLFTATGTLKHRLISADQPVSPFLLGGLGYQHFSSEDLYGLKEEDDDGDAWSFTLGAGCDFRMTGRWAFALEASWTDWQSISEGAPFRWTVNVGAAMKYYFGEEDLPYVHR